MYHGVGVLQERIKCIFLREKYELFIKVTPLSRQSKDRKREKKVKGGSGVLERKGELQMDICVRV